MTPGSGLYKSKHPTLKKKKEKRPFQADFLKKALLFLTHNRYFWFYMKVKL